MDNKNTCIIHLAEDQPSKWNEYLFQFYYPMIKTDASILYCIMEANQKQKMTLEILLKLSMLTQTRFDQARKVLEQFSLLRTFFNAAEEVWYFLLQPIPKPVAFLSNETYARLFFNELGAKRYKELSDHYKVKLPEDPLLAEVSETFDVTRLHSWDDKKERAFEHFKPVKSDQKYTIDFEKLFAISDRLFEPQMRTKTNLDLIDKMYKTYGLSIKQVKQALSRAVNTYTHTFDQKAFQFAVHAISPSSTSAITDMYKLPPAQFLKQKQNGIDLSSADQRLLERLVSKYQLQTEVVNTLVEYVLDNNNQQLPANYTEKIAASWVRNQIDSREKALNLIQNPQPANNKKNSTRYKNRNELPDWYSDTGQDKEVDKELLKRLQQQQKEMKGA